MPENEHFGSKSRVFLPRYTEGRKEKKNPFFLKPEILGEKKTVLYAANVLFYHHEEAEKEGEETDNTREAPEMQLPRIKTSLGFFSKKIRLLIRTLAAMHPESNHP